MTANISSVLRKRIYRREGYRCALCDSPRYLQIHHVVARGKGGPVNNPQNLICLCSDCHDLAHGIDLRGLQDVEKDRQIDGVHGGPQPFIKKDYCFFDSPTPAAAGVFFALRAAGGRAALNK